MPNTRAVENELRARVAYLDIALIFLHEYRKAKGQRQETLPPIKNSPVETATFMHSGCVGSRLPMEQVWKERDEQNRQWNEEYMTQYNRKQSKAASEKINE